MSFLGGRDHLDESLHGYRCGAFPSSGPCLGHGGTRRVGAMGAACTSEGNQIL